MHLWSECLLSSNIWSESYAYGWVCSQQCQNERVVGQIKIMEGMKFKTAEIGFKTRIIFWCHGILSNSAICELQVLISGMNCSILSILNTQLLRFFFNRQILTING